MSERNDGFPIGTRPVARKRKRYASLNELATRSFDLNSAKPAEHGRVNEHARAQEGENGKNHRKNARQDRETFHPRMKRTRTRTRMDGTYYRKSRARRMSSIKAVAYDGNAQSVGDETIQKDGCLIHSHATCPMSEPESLYKPERSGVETQEKYDDQDVVQVKATTSSGALIGKRSAIPVEQRPDTLALGLKVKKLQLSAMARRSSNTFIHQQTMHTCGREMLQPHQENTDLEQVSPRPKRDQSCSCEPGCSSKNKGRRATDTGGRVAMPQQKYSYNTTDTTRMGAAAAHPFSNICSKRASGSRKQNPRNYDIEGPHYGQHVNSCCLQNSDSCKGLIVNKHRLLDCENTSIAFQEMKSMPVNLTATGLGRDQLREGSSNVSWVSRLTEAFQVFQREQLKRITLSEWSLKDLDPKAMEGRWIALSSIGGNFRVGRILCYQSWTRYYLIQYVDGVKEFCSPSRGRRCRVVTYPGESLPLHPQHNRRGSSAVSHTKKPLFLPGEILWTGDPNFQLMPALVVTKLDIQGNKTKLPTPLHECTGMIYVQYFGTYECNEVCEDNCTYFLKGLQAVCWEHIDCRRSILVDTMEEVTTYLGQGKLPSGMCAFGMDAFDCWRAMVTAEPTRLATFEPVRMKKEDAIKELKKKRDSKNGVPKLSQQEKVFSRRSSTKNSLLSDKTVDVLAFVVEKKSPTEMLDQKRIGSSKEDRQLKDHVNRTKHVVERVMIQHEQLQCICFVCNEWEEYEDNMLLDCSNCGTVVHMQCYGVTLNPNGEVWLCDPCAAGIKEIPLCALCPVEDGRALKRTTCGRWVHSACAMWMPEVFYTEPEKMNLVSGLDRISKIRFQLRCSVCRNLYGACLQCDHAKCYTSYHVLCARHKGFLMDFVETFDNSTERLIRTSLCKRHSVLKQKANLRSKPSICPKKRPEKVEAYPLQWKEGCSRAHAFTNATVGRRAQVGTAKRGFVQNLPFVVSGCMRTGDTSFKPKAGRNVALLTAKSNIQSRNMLSNLERIERMHGTASQRITIGKSAIHGWGVFCKVPHKKGDFIVEYIGDLTRSVVCDLREARDYKKLVGAGTYLFKVTHEFAVDATRNGNIAHLLNHSCTPNCYSRVLRLNSVEHIIIIALHDLNPGEELTYDYRFSSDEDLFCNCGSAYCRGTVNFDGMSKDYFLAPMTELQHVLLGYSMPY